MPRNPESDQSVINLTVVIGDLRGQLRKLHWNAWQVRVVRRERNSEAAPFVFACIDYAKTAAALQDWTVRTYVAWVRRGGGSPVLGDDPATSILDGVSYQRAMRSIANTAKHGGYDDRVWPGGLVTLRLDADAGVLGALLDLDHDKAFELMHAGLKTGSSRWNGQLQQDDMVVPLEWAIRRNLDGWKSLLMEADFF